MKKLSICVLIALACALLCGPALGEVFTPALDTDADYTLTIAGKYNNFEALEAEFDAFSAYYPYAQLTYRRLEDYNKLISLALSGYEAPDIYFAYEWLYDYETFKVPVSQAEDLSDESLGLALDVYRPALLHRDLDGKIAMVPVFTSTYGMLVNNDIFDKLGLSVPTDWASLTEACERLVEAGYANPILGYNGDYTTFQALAMPFFCAGLVNNSDAVAQLVALDSAAGEYMRPALEGIQRLMDAGYLDLNACATITDNYQSIILRFFEGDVPMMIANGDVVSGTEKRESMSEAYQQNPFSYAFYPVPLADEGCYFFDLMSLEFAVNSQSANLDIANEFMRFLVSYDQLNNMAQIKRLVTPTTDMSLDGIYAPFGMMPAERTISASELGLTDPVNQQLRYAAFAVGNGRMTVDEAVAAYGTLIK